MKRQPVILLEVHLSYSEKMPLFNNAVGDIPGAEDLEWADCSVKTYNVNHYAVRLMYLVEKLWQLPAHIFRQHMKRQLYHTLVILTEAEPENENGGCRVSMHTSLDEQFEEPWRLLGSDSENGEVQLLKLTGSLVSIMLTVGASLIVRLRFGKRKENRTTCSKRSKFGPRVKPQTRLVDFLTGEGDIWGTTMRDNVAEVGIEHGTFGYNARCYNHYTMVAYPDLSISGSNLKSHRELIRKEEKERTRKRYRSAIIPNAKILRTIGTFPRQRRGGTATPHYHHGRISVHIG
ncbi:hypothetical protein DAPPUDRAFT_101174 [Daphnia pulex]|uniref:Uncharacterized protein n=1 Tax=Daphnia pulex TaxID=6669 RepID=E9GCK5_DAPPU|nr:hypothetical protein DAPPUDRAFT_101174 [Daphnia pulex]|eukprot:EFX82572.1 hypothetical protein DAPPUDRAFT_101174 [Daphnia pulex]